MSNKYKGGFTVRGKEPYETEEWLYSEKHSNENRLVFLGYDANLFPTPNLSERPKTEYNEKWNEKLMKKASEFTKDFMGEVWLDDVRIKRREAK